MDLLITLAHAMITITPQNVGEISRRMIGAEVVMTGTVQHVGDYMISLDHKLYCLSRSLFYELLRCKSLPAELLFAVLEYQDAQERKRIDSVKTLTYL